MEVMTIAELHKRSNDFAAQDLFKAGYLFTAYAEGTISHDIFLALAKISAPSIEETELFVACARYHPTQKIVNKHKITVSIP